MPKKSYTVIIQIDLNTIDCPGVWLCPKGKAFLKVCLFGVADVTKDVDPFFPLVIRERFIFEKDFKEVSSAYELHDKIGRSVISIELLQCPVGSPGCVKLAIFNSLLADLLHPYSSCFAKPPDTSGIELLFTTCKIFPGIIAPKADVSLKVVVADMNEDVTRPNVRRMPLKLRKGDTKRQQSVCHSKNGLNCGCFSRNGAQPRELQQPNSGDGITNEPNAFAGRATPYRSSTDYRPKTSQFYPKPPSRLTPHNQKRLGQYRGPQKPIQPLMQNKKPQLTQKEPDYEEEPDTNWAKVNFGVAFGPGEFKDDQNDGNTWVSSDWEYNWDGQKGNKNKGKRKTILSARRHKLSANEKYNPMEGREDAYGDEAIKREMYECKKLLKDYNPDDVRNDPELKIKYDNCVKNIEWLQKYGGKSSSSDKLLTSTEELGQAANKRAMALPCHGKCCKCKEEQGGTGPGKSIDHEGQTYKERQSWDRDLLSPINEQSEWFPRKEWEKERQREVKRKKERFWEHERVIHERDRRSQHVRGNGMPDGPRPDGKDEQEQRQRERERRRFEEVIRQHKARERMSRLQQESSSDQELDESIGSVDGLQRTVRPSEAPRGEPPRAEKRVFSPERVSKPSTNTTKQTRPSTSPYSGIRQDQMVPGPTTKRMPTPPQFPKRNDERKSPEPPQRPPISNSRPDKGDSAEDHCDCDLCEQYQELYNPTSHPCPRFHKTTKNTDRDTPLKNSGAGAKKLVSSRKSTRGNSNNGNSRKIDRNRDRQNEQCGLSSCDGPIDIETIEEMNAIQKFYYGKKEM